MNNTSGTTAQCEDAAIQLEHDFVEIIRSRIGLNETLATIHAQEIVRGLRERHGGQELWIPAPDKSERNAAVRREFNGRNVREVCAKHGISRTHLYRIVGGAQPGGKGRPGAASIGVSGPAGRGQHRRERAGRSKKSPFTPSNGTAAPVGWSAMSTATDMIAAYLAAETAILAGKDVSFQGRRVTMEDLDAIRKGRQEWEARAKAEAQPGCRRGGMGNYAVARFD